MSRHPERIYVARLIGLDVFDPAGDRLGRARDVVLHFHRPAPPLAVGFVVEITGKRHVFMPTTRILSVDEHHIMSTGLVNLRRFEKRGTEQLIAADLLDRHVTLVGGSGTAAIEDVALERQPDGDWLVSTLFVRCPGNSRRWQRSRGETALIGWHEIENPFPAAATKATSVNYDHLPPAGVADSLHHLPDQERLTLALQFQDDRLARVLQELPQNEQVGLIQALEQERAVSVLTAMEPDDAADLLASLPRPRSSTLLAAMPMHTAEGLQRLLRHEEGTAGALMTPSPVIVGPDTTVAEALARVYGEEVPPTLAAVVFVCQPPLETPTGKYVGAVGVQALLRTPPPEQVHTLADTSSGFVRETTPLRKLASTMALYNLMCLPVLSDSMRLMGAVTVDDLLDHLLPSDWRSRELDENSNRKDSHTGSTPSPHQNTLQQQGRNP